MTAKPFCPARNPHRARDRPPMTVLSAQSIHREKILDPCLPRTTEHGLTYGLGPCGYDLRLDLGLPDKTEAFLRPGEFCLAATLEHFTMSARIMGVVHDKSTWARKGLSCFNTVIEPGWRGYLTLELVNHSSSVIYLMQGMAIAQVVFRWLDAPTQIPYAGKYQDQESGPQGPRE